MVFLVIGCFLLFFCIGIDDAVGGNLLINCELK